MKKKISILIPCFNEVENVEGISAAVEEVIKKDLSNYDYEIVFIDNASTDGTRDKIEKICKYRKIDGDCFISSDNFDNDGIVEIGVDIH